MSFFATATARQSSLTFWVNVHQRLGHVVCLLEKICFLRSL